MATVGTIPDLGGVPSFGPAGGTAAPSEIRPPAPRGLTGWTDSPIESRAGIEMPHDSWSADRATESASLATTHTAVP